jgi:hypothetical protein
VDMDYGSADITDHTLITDGGTIVLDGNIAMTDVDPNIIFDVTTTTDTDYWIGVTEDAGGDDDDLFQIGDGTTPGTNPFLTIDTSGAVAIGVAAGDGTLHAHTGSAGSVTATFRQDVYITDLAAVGTDPLCWDGSGASLIGDCSSLRQWKSNIVDTEMGLAEVLQLRAREFDWDEQHGHGKHDVGFVAEEVEEVNPLLVTYRPELTGVKYNRLTALLVKAMQELEARVAALE